MARQRLCAACKRGECVECSNVLARNDWCECGHPVDAVQLVLPLAYGTSGRPSQPPLAGRLLPSADA